MTIDAALEPPRLAGRYGSAFGGAVAAVRAGDVTPGELQVDLERLYRTQWHALVRLAVLLVDDVGSAEDVVQDAFVNLHRRASALRSPESALAYLRTSIVNGSRSVLRRRQVARRHLRAVAAETDYAEPSAEPADQLALVAVEHAALMDAVRRLPRRQREVLVLRYFSDLSEAQIAAALGVSTGTVKSTASRGLDALEQLMGHRP